MGFTTITAAAEQRVGVLTFNRPEVLNAFNPTLMSEASAALGEFERDPAISTIVVHGNGRAFSSGFASAGGLAAGLAACPAALTALAAVSAIFLATLFSAGSFLSLFFTVWLLLIDKRDGVNAG